jgi:hypothetical protein
MMAVSHQGKWAVKMLVQVEDLSGAWTGVFSPQISHSIHRSAADGGFMPAGRRLPLEAFIFSSPSRERSLCPSVALLECPSGVLISRPPGALLFWFWAFFLGGESVKGDLCGLGGDVVCCAGGACVLLVVYELCEVGSFGEGEKECAGGRVYVCDPAQRIFSCVGEAIRIIPAARLFFTPSAIYPQTSWFGTLRVYVVYMQIENYLDFGISSRQVGG